MNPDLAIALQLEPDDQRHDPIDKIVATKNCGRRIYG
jgi:hypothetical protein